MLDEHLLLQAAIAAAATLENQTPANCFVSIEVHSDNGWGKTLGSSSCCIYVEEKRNA